MLLRDHFDILLVDDNPDVLTVSKLVLKHVTFFGAPLKVHTAASKAEAMTLLKATKADFAVGFINIVMETEHAGLELCQWIREELGNSTTQLAGPTRDRRVAPRRRRSSTATT